jgi:hypothetical protein
VLHIFIKKYRKLRLAGLTKFSNFFDIQYNEALMYSLLGSYVYRS